VPNQNETYEVRSDIFTVPNLISFIRLCTIPLFIYLILQGDNIAACVVFALAAGTDWVDGQVARRTNQVSKLGQLLDPAVDRILMISGVICLLIVGRLPLWIILFVLARDLLLLYGGSVLLTKYNARVPVIFAGKVATTLLYIGFAGVVLNLPLVAGLDLCSFDWLPLFNAQTAPIWFVFVYAGLFLSLFTTIYYVRRFFETLEVEKQKAQVANGE
jgi:cardiolipin synthase